MAYAFNPLDPMNHSMYLESLLPDSIDSAISTLPNYPAPGPNPNGPRLRPQLTKDSWYYNKDGADDGRISTFEKLKAFVKGGTYNMVRGMFCDKDGFSFGRTLATAAGITAIALTGPIGAAIAGGVGLVCAADNFAQSVRNAKYATTDQQAREAYEGVGESTTTAGLSLFGGFKGFNAIKNNFAYAKNNKISISLKDKLTKWDVSKLYPVKPQPQPANPAPAAPTSPAPAGNTTPPPAAPAAPEPAPAVPKPKKPAGTSRKKPTASGRKKPATTRKKPASRKPEKPVNNPTPTAETPQPSGNTVPREIKQPEYTVPEIDASGYVPDWKPTGYPEKPTPVEYVSDWEPVGNMPKPQTPEYFSPYEPISPELLKPAPKPTAPKTPEIIPDTAPIDNSVLNPPKPQYDFSYGQNNNHFFG